MDLRHILYVRDQPGQILMWLNLYCEELWTLLKRSNQEREMAESRFYIDKMMINGTVSLETLAALTFLADTTQTTLMFTEEERIASCIIRMISPIIRHDELAAHPEDSFIDDIIAQTPDESSLIKQVQDSIAALWQEQIRALIYRHLYNLIRSRAMNLADQCQHDSATLETWQRKLGQFLVACAVRHQVPVSGSDRELIRLYTRKERFLVRLGLESWAKGNRFVLASALPHPVASQVFSRPELESLRNDDVYLAECRADAVTAIELEYTTEEGQERVRREVLKTAQDNGSIRARMMLRKMRSHFALSPYYFELIESELQKHP